MGERPIGTTLDRKDPTKGYKPSNCRWATHREQQNNKLHLTKICKDGEVHTIGEWVYLLDLTTTERNKIYKRYSAYRCVEFEDLFYEGSLLTKRVNERENHCLVCGREDSIKW